MRLILFVLGIIITFSLLYIFRSVLLPFVAGLVIAYLLWPLIRWIERRLPERRGWLATRRFSIIAFIFVVIVALACLLAFYIGMSVAASFSVLINEAPQYITQGLHTLQEWLSSFSQSFPQEIEQQIEGFISDLGKLLGDAMKHAFTGVLTFVPSTLGLILGFVSLPIFLFYLLMDAEKLSNSFYSVFPSQMATHVRGIVSVIGEVLGQWARSELLISFTVACVCFVGLFILGIKLAPALAVFAGITEFIPILGPWIGGAVGVLVTLAIAPEKVIWVALVYVLASLLENTLIRPRIQGAYLRIHPAIILVLLSLGSYIAGILGIILINPLTATIIEIYKYIRRNIAVEETQQSSV